MSMPRGHVILFLREPRLGRVKSRLARDIGSLPALRHYRTFCTAVLRAAGAGPGWRLWLAVTPDRFVRVRRTWPALGRRRFRRLKQGRGDLGRRMARALAAPPPGAAMIVGTDVPDVDRGALREAFAALKRSDAVFGPADDGGYWLVGLSARARPLARGRALFRDVRWSGPHALADSKRSLGGRNVGEIRTLQDIDTGADLARRHLSARRGPSPLR